MADDDRKIFVLVVDDDADLVELIQMALEEANAVVVTARNGKQALALLEFIDPHVIVLDMMMPVLDGFGFLRAYEGWSERAPVLAMSALPAYLDEAPAAGAADVLEKPFDLGEMARRVKALVEGERRPPRPPSRSAVAEESARLAAISAFGLDTRAPEPALQEFVDRVAEHLRAPIALISIVTEDRQGWHAQCGLSEEVAASSGFPRSHSFCTHAVAGRAALVVQDTHENPLFRENPVVAEHNLRFYAGVPLILRTGEAVGTLCIMDHKPRPFSHFDLELLSVFARRIVAGIETRELDKSEMPASALRYPGYLANEGGTFSRRAFEDLVAVEGARGASLSISTACVALEVPGERLRTIADELRRVRTSSFVGRLDALLLGWLVPASDPEDARRAAIEAAGEGARAAAVDVRNYAAGGATHLAVSDAVRKLRKGAAPSD